MLQIKAPSLSITTSTASASGQVLPVGSVGRFLRIVNGSASIVYVNGGGSGVVATSANVAIAPNATVTLERTPTDDYVAALLATGTGTISITVTGSDV